MNSSFLLPWAALLLASAAIAAPKPADPADAKAAVPPTVYTSSLQQYKPLKDGEVGDWRSANRRVAPPQAAASAAASAPSAASAPAHHHH